MELTPVESSNVQGFCYFEDLQCLRVGFKSGGVYDYPDVSPEVYAEFLVAESKGGFVANRLVKRGGVKTDAVEAKLPDKKLQSYQDDKCCGSALSKALKSGALDAAETWTHETCGCEWKPRMVGDVRFWEPHELIAIL